MQKFIIRIFLFIFPMISIVILVNYVGDSANLFREGIEEYIANGILSGYNVTNVYNYDERLLQKHIILNSNTCPDIAVLGSSTIMLINSKYFKNRRVKNNGVSGVSIEDLIAIIQLYKTKNCLPENIIIGLDPWVLNENNNQSRWRTLINEYNNFFDGKIESSANTIYVENSTFYQLVSPSYFQSSLKALLSSKSKPGKPLLTLDSINSATTRLQDGSLSYGDSYRSLSAEQIEFKVSQYLSGRIYSIDKFNQLSPRIIYQLDKLLEFLISKKVCMTFILAPYHPKVYDHIASSKKYSKVIESEIYFNALSEKYNVKLIGSYNPHQLNINKSYFYDGMHLNEKGIDKLLQNQFDFAPN